jgi:hypothetical protein
MVARTPPVLRRLRRWHRRVLKFGLEWRYRGTDLTDLELFEPGHRPVLAWRSLGLPA